MPSLSLLVLRCTDLDVSRRFYEALGLHFVPEQHGAGPAHLASTLADDTVVELYPADGRPADDVRLGFRVDRIDEILGLVEGLGGSIVRTASGAVVTDPDGRRVEVVAGAR